MDEMNNIEVTTVEETTAKAGLPTTGSKILDAAIVLAFINAAYDVGEAAVKTTKKVVKKIKAKREAKKQATETALPPEGTPEEKTED